MTTPFAIETGFIAEQNHKARPGVEEDYEALARKLRRHGDDIEDLVARAQSFRVAIPSWGVGTGGTRFARFPGPGEPRDVFDKLEDCAVVQQLGRMTPTVSLHFPWDKPDDAGALREFAAARGL